MSLNAWQTKILESFEKEDYKRIVVMQRCVGLTTALAYYATTYALKHPNSTLGYISHNKEAASRFISHIQQYMGPKYYRTNWGWIKFENDSQIIVASAQSINLFTGSRLDGVLIDNCCEIGGDRIKELTQALLPSTVLTKGKFFICGTCEDKGKLKEYLKSL